jgi:CRP/FNR family transcriptional regulator, cyclic AMP receptor protein
MLTHISSPTTRKATRRSLPLLQQKLSPEAAWHTLKSMDIFTPVPDAALKGLTALSRTLVVERGDAVFRQDEPCREYLYVVVDGEITLAMESADGRESIVAIMKGGDFFGDLSLWDGSHYGLTAVAGVHSRLLCLRREDLFRCMREFPDFAFTLVCELSHRLRTCLQRLTHLAHQRVEKRLAALFLRLFEERGVRLKDELGRRCVLLRNRPRQLDLAEMAGTSRETVSRIMTQWEKVGWIRDEPSRDLFLLDEDALRRRLE